MRRRGFDPAKDKISDLDNEKLKELMKCKKNFPKIVPEGAGVLQAHVIMDFNKIVRYNPPRDNPFINNFHPVFMHLWGANTDMQVLHGEGTLCDHSQRSHDTGSSFAVSAYVTSYISKLDKFGTVSWRDVIHELEGQLRASTDVHKGMHAAV
jgi:hypothetical protein